MSFFDKFRKPAKPLTATSKQPENLYLAVQKYKDRPDCSVSYLHRSQIGDIPVPVQVIPLIDTLEVAQRIEEFISSKWGGGHWQVKILDGNNRTLCTYQMPVAGPVYNTKTGKKKVPGDSDGSDGSASGGKRNPYEEMMMKVFEKNLNPMEQMTQLAGVMQSLSGGSSGLESLAAEIVSTTVNNNVSREEGRLNEIKSIIEIGQMFTPKVAAEDPLSNVIAALPGVIGGLAAMKSSGNSAPAAPARQMAALPVHDGNGGIDMNALRSAALSMPPAMIGNLPADQQAAIIKLRQSAPANSQQSAILPRPGAPVQGGQPPQDGGAGDFRGSTGPPSPPYHAAIDTMIVDIRQDLAAGLPDSQVAKKMISMVTFAKGFAGESPHPMLAGILSATDETGNDEFARLCNQIPELRGNHARIGSLGAEILTLMRAGATETLDSLEDTPQAGQGNIHDSAVPEFAYETEAEREAADKSEAASHGDAFRPSRIPEGENSEEQPGRVQDPADSEQIRKTA